MAKQILFCTTKPVRSFSKIASKVFDEKLLSHGFSLSAKKVEKDFYKHVYLKGTQYIEVHANTHPHDAPNYCNIKLGEGSVEWPECDWNGVGLAVLVAKVDPKRVEPGEDLYGLKYVEDIDAVLTAMLRDLVRYAEDFLQGDLAKFKKVRAWINRQREPYKIYRPNSSGKYRSYIDSESARLKDKYS